MKISDQDGRLYTEFLGLHFLHRGNLIFPKQLALGSLALHNAQCGTPSTHSRLLHPFELL